MKLHFIPLLLAILFSLQSCHTENQILWQIGENNNSAKDLALGPGQYKSFLEKDFGFEDRFFLVGHSGAQTDFPYALPGPDNVWGGTSVTAGIRSHKLNLWFCLKEKPQKGQWKLVLDLIEKDTENAPVVKITCNNYSKTLSLQKGKNKEALFGKYDPNAEEVIQLPIDSQHIKQGHNEISIHILQGGYIIFDQLRMEAPNSTSLKTAQKAYIKSVQPASYEIEKKHQSFQPLLVEVQHLEGTPKLTIQIDGKTIFSQTVEQGSYKFEAPMPAVESETKTNYSIYLDEKLIETGDVVRQPCPKESPAQHVNTTTGTGHSRWMIAPGPWMPFGMVKLSPDNQNAGWQAGYDPSFESIGCFSHIHEWTMGGLGIMPVTGPLQIKVGDEKDPDSGYRSRINKSTEQAPIGYYSVELTDYNIRAELTATERCGFQRYTFHDSLQARILVDLQIPCEYSYQNKEIEIRQVNDYRIEGFSHQLSPDTWAGGIDQEYTIFFVIEFDQPIQKSGAWINDHLLDTTYIRNKNVKDAGYYAEFDTGKNQKVQVRTGISYVSIENAAMNLAKEIADPFGWSFEAVRAYQVSEWNRLLNRIRITTDNQFEKHRFYTNFYHSLCSRNTFSDTDGSWRDADEKIQKFSNPEDLALGCDAFWNTFWNLNQLWNLATPEWSGKWVRSQLAMYDTKGWLAKGLAGMEYIPVMVAEHEIPLIVAAYQMGIRDYDVEKAFQACYKMQTTPAQKVGGGFAGNRDLEAYLKYKYVPEDKGRFSNTLEYSFDDWTLAQFAKALGKKKEYNTFIDRAYWWKNAMDPETGFARLRNSNGKWLEDFDPFRSGANHHYVEGNAWQLSFFVPQDVPELAKTIGKEQFCKRLEWGFEESNKWRFNAPNDAYWDYPVIQGNQQSMHFTYLFNWVGKPWLTQKWSRAILERYYGYGVSNAYLGDEDQGQMSAWFIMASIGLFQTDGGCSVNPVYEIASPLYQKIEIDLGKRYGRGEQFIIEAKNASRKNKYIQSARLNGKKLQDFKFPAKELLKGGKLELEMGAEPNQNWGVK